jgi:hypothetical protein
MFSAWKLMMKTGFSVRYAKIGHMKTSPIKWKIDSDARSKVHDKIRKNFQSNCQILSVDFILHRKKKLISNYLQQRWKTDRV